MAHWLKPFTRANDNYLETPVYVKEESQCTCPTLYTRIEGIFFLRYKQIKRKRLAHTFLNKWVQTFPRDNCFFLNNLGFGIMQIKSFNLTHPYRFKENKVLQKWKIKLFILSNYSKRNCTCKTKQKIINICLNQSKSKLDL